MQYKLVVFDLDGTILDNTIYIWKTLHEYFKTDPVRRQQAYMDYKNKKISYAEWAKIDIELLKEKKTTKTEIEKLFQNLKLMKGAKDTLEILKNNGYKLAIISGSVNTALETVFPDYRNYFSDVFLNKLVFDNSGYLVDVIPTPYDMEHKATGLEYLMQKYNIKRKETVFVGDNENDIYIAQKAGLSIAFNSKSEKLNKISSIIIDKKDLRELLKVLKNG